MRDEMKCDALIYGRYPKPFTAARYDSRNKAAAFRSIAYNAEVRNVSAIEAIIDAIETTKVVLRTK